MTKNEKWIEVRAWIRGFRNAPNWSARWWHFKEILWIIIVRSSAKVSAKVDQTGQAVTAYALMLTLLALIATASAVQMTQQSVRSVVVQSVRNEAHANAKHPEAMALREWFKSTPGVETYWSLSRGTILALFRTEDGRWGGIVWRVTEDNGLRWLGDECYECTTFATSRLYWDGVILDGGYLPLIGFPDLMGLWWNWIRAQFRM